MNKFDLFLQDSFLYITIRKRMLENVIFNYYKDYSNKLNGKIILEIGCSNGHGASLIKKYFSPKKIIATDLDERLLNLAKRNIKDASIKFDIADATKLQFNGDTFDAIFDFGVIHHIPDWENCLKELHRVLKPKGHIFIYDISIESFDNLWGRIIKKLTLHPYDSMYRREEFNKYLKKLGFKILINNLYKASSRYFVIVAQKCKAISNPRGL